jgi:hypothetical protein
MINTDIHTPVGSAVGRYRPGSHKIGRSAYAGKAKSRLPRIHVEETRSVNVYGGNRFRHPGRADNMLDQEMKNGRQNLDRSATHWVPRHVIRNIKVENAMKKAKEPRQCHVLSCSSSCSSAS